MLKPKAAPGTLEYVEVSNSLGWWANSIGGNGNGTLDVCESTCTANSGTCVGFTFDLSQSNCYFLIQTDIETTMQGTSISNNYISYLRGINKVTASTSSSSSNTAVLWYYTSFMLALFLGFLVVVTYRTYPHHVAY